jgi:hypothetical protein
LKRPVALKLTKASKYRPHFEQRTEGESTPLLRLQTMAAAGVSQSQEDVDV